MSMVSFLSWACSDQAAGILGSRNSQAKLVMAGHRRPKDGVASARLCPAIHVLLCGRIQKDVDARDKPGHDGN
jgi:hypothetical protein